MLVNTREILEKASKEGYGVGAFNFVNFETLEAIYKAAVQQNSPLIIEASEGAIKYMGLDVIRALVDALSLRYGAIPSALHLDHGTSFESCKAAVDAGFNSVMIDASHHPFDENLALTKQVVDYAHAHGVSVEAELGQLKGIEDNIEVSEADATLVNVEEAAIFVKESGVDFLAPAIGTSHGAFKFKGEPRLDFVRLRAVKEATGDIPLVLHGASAVPEYIKERFKQSGGEISSGKGVPFALLKEAVRDGINKVNTDTDLRLSFMAEVRALANAKPSEFDLRKFFNPAMAAITSVVAERMEVLGSKDKA